MEQGGTREGGGAGRELNPRVGHGGHGGKGRSPGEVGKPRVGELHRGEGGGCWGHWEALKQSKNNRQFSPDLHAHHRGNQRHPFKLLGML